MKRFFLHCLAWLAGLGFCLIWLAAACLGLFLLLGFLLSGGFR